MSRKKKKGAGDVARDRLQSVLREDRTQMSAGTLSAMRADIVGVLSSYTTVKDEDVNFYMVRGDAQSETRLMMEAVVRSGRDRGAPASDSTVLKPALPA